ncbi:site-specific DNA-methyltransferase [Salinicoccus albus]|uniref:site-specific DNA-methyltransferase n=1 Tax=Salinicoccus albus TaxID=418756 RepID=UPI00038080A4|nr:site-specific DNA-methyltransferase [Salinicoccus albus]
METKLQQEIKNVLKVFPEYWNEDTLLKNKLIEDIRSYNKEIIEALLSNHLIKETYALQLPSGTIFKVEDFISMLRFKNYWDNSFTKYTNEIGLTSENKFLKYNTDVILDFPHKDGILEGGMSREEKGKREIYYHSVIAKEEIDTLLSPKALTNIKKYNKEGEHEVTYIDDTDNLIVKGNNLLALYSLKKRYANKVKLIYIDPPYNTGNDSFKYNDRFNHSTWLTFMKNRLEVAKDFLSNDGVIFIQIDDKELHYLKVLCDEVFGRTNFLNTMVVKTSDPSGHKVVNPSPYSQTEYLLMYAKDKSKYKYEIKYVEAEYDTAYNKYIVNYTEGFENWEVVSLSEFIAKKEGYGNVREAKINLGETVFVQLVADFALDNKESVYQSTAISKDAGKEIIQVKNESKENKGIVYHIPRKDYEDIYILNGRQMYFYSSKVKEIYGEQVPAKPLTNLWADIPYNGLSKEGGVSLKNGKKPEKLLHRIIEISTEKNDIVMDFFLGSGTTAAVAHKMERQFIGIEQLFYGENDSVTRLKNVIKGDSNSISKIENWQGGGSFIYAELYSLNEEFLYLIQSSQNKEELEDALEEIKNRAYLNFKVQLEKAIYDNSIFSELSLEEQKEVLIQVLDMNQLYLNYSEIEDSQYDISDSVKAFNHSFYQKEGGKNE